MDTIRSLLALLLVLICGVCILVFAGYYNDGIDFLGLGQHAIKFPIGPESGPIAVALGSLMIAYFIYPGGSAREQHHHHHN